MSLHPLDRELLDRCLKHEPGSWNEFVDRYMGLIYHVIHHIAHARSLDLSTADVEDLAAEVLLGIVDDDYAVLRKFRSASSLPTYLTVVARRIAIKEIVKRQREAELGHVSAHRNAMTEDELTSDTEPLATAEQIEQILKDLPERDAEVVRLRHLKSLSYRQIARQLGISENTIGPILSRAHKRLKRLSQQRQNG